MVDWCCFVRTNFWKVINYLYRVPFTAGNIIDLLKKIKKDPVIFPFKVHPYIKDVIRKMLVVDPNKRI